MNYLSDDLAKIKIIDRAFTSLSLDEITAIFGADVIVDKLKGSLDCEGPLAQAARELQTLENDIIVIRSECQMLKLDIQTLVRCMNRGMGDSMVTSDFNSLKLRHGIY